VSGPVFSAIAGDTLRSLNIPPDMAVKQMVVSDDPASGTPATDIKKAERDECEPNPPKKLKVSTNPKNHPGVVR